MLYSLRLSEICPCFGQDWYYTLAPGRCCGIINWSEKDANEESIAPLMELFIVPLFPVSVSIAAFSSVQFSRSVVSNSLRPHESQHARPPYPSPTPRVHSDSRPLSQGCHPAISSSVVPFSSCPQSLPASESFPRVNSSHEVAKILEFQHLLIALVMFYSQYCSFSQKMGSLLLIIISMRMELKDLGLSSLFRYCCIN